MNNIQEYYLDFFETVISFFKSILLGVTECVNGSGKELTPTLLVALVWVVVTLAAVVGVFYATSLPKHIWLFIVLVFPIVGALAYLVVEVLFRKRQNATRNHSNYWNDDAPIVKNYLFWCPIGVAAGVYVMLLLLKMINFDVTMEELLAISYITGLMVLIIMIPIAFGKLRDSETLVYIGDGEAMEMDEQLDARLIKIVTSSKIGDPSEKKPIISQEDLEEDENPDEDARIYVGYKERQLKGLFFKEEQKVQAVVDDIYHVEYLDVDGQRSSFVVKGKSNLGALVMSINTAIILCIYFTPFLLFVLNAAEGFFELFA